MDIQFARISIEQESVGSWPRWEMSPGVKVPDFSRISFFSRKCVRPVYRSLAATQSTQTFERPHAYRRCSSGSSKRVEPLLGTGISSVSCWITQLPMRLGPTRTATYLAAGYVGHRKVARLAVGWQLPENCFRLRHRRRRNGGWRHRRKSRPPAVSSNEFVRYGWRVCDHRACLSSRLIASTRPIPRLFGGRQNSRRPRL